MPGPICIIDIVAGRRLLFFPGSRGAFSGLGRQAILSGFPEGSPILWLIIGLQVVIFWLMVFPVRFIPSSPPGPT